ncbi:MAG: DUF1343 domain-containing protein [Lachnospiraceae bacterium]|nr:DUF1343 domain-containing protein [Lachnospiraceae bacterium]
MKTILGLDRLDEFESVFRGKRIGLITNYSGVNSEWKMNVDLFMEKGLQIVRLFTPEHGMFGEGAGKPVDNDVYPGYRIPIVSLFGDHVRPLDSEMDGIDIMVYDIQDVGLRYYTYIYTMTYCMEAAAECNIPFVVLDRPNPLGNRIVSGGTILPEFNSFIGDYELPVRYGLTCGEVGNYFLQYKGLKMDYQVIPLKNYTRDTYFSDTGLLWNIPSPALVDFDSTICYSGGCFAGATSISDGRGSSKPFQMYGAPYINMDQLYKEMKTEVREEKVIFRQRAFMPVERKYVGQVCFGLEFAPLDKMLDFIPVVLQMMRQVARLYPEQFTLVDGGEGGKHLHYVTGSRRTDDYLFGRISLKQLLEEWDAQSAQFERETESVRIYV